MKQKVYNLIILDESGSMEAIAQQAVSGLNETLQTIQTAQKEHEDQEHYISFVTFNSSKINTVMDCVKVDKEKKMKWTDFAPNSCTPLFDAMGQSLSKLREMVEEKDAVLVTIITDGMENASREYSGTAIKEMVANLRKRGWVFVYIGTNQDVDAVANDMGINFRLSFDYSAPGTDVMFKKAKGGMKGFFSKLADCCSTSFADEDDYQFFSED